MIRKQEIIKEYYEKYVLPNNPRLMPYEFLCANEVQEMTGRFSFKVFEFRKAIENLCQSLADALK